MNGKHRMTGYIKRKGRKDIKTEWGKEASKIEKKEAKRRGRKRKKRSRKEKRDERKNRENSGEGDYKGLRKKEV